MAELTITEATQTTLKTDDNKPHRVCAYCRVSTDDTDQRNSLEAQKMFFERYFQIHSNWTNIGIYADEGLSGTSLEKRDEFNRMIFEAKRGNIDLILTKEVSRFSRNVRDIMQIVEELRDIGVYVWFLSDDINTEKIEDRGKLTHMANIAEQESIRTSNRVKWGHQQRMQMGVVFGRKEMYGYNIVKDDYGFQHFQIIPDEAEVIKNIFEWFASGEGTHRIARKLEQKGIETKRYKNGWSNTVILRILRNEKYVGDLVQGKTYTPDPLKHKKKYNKGGSRVFTIKDHHPESAIISRELWDKVQTILGEKAPTEQTKAKHSNRYWTSGKIFCGICGGRYVSYTKKQKNFPYKAWVCFENHQRGNKKTITLDNGKTANVGCDALRVNDKVLKTAIHDIITQIIQPHKEQIIKDLKNEIKAVNKPTDNSTKIARITKEIEATNEILDELALNLAKKVLSAETYSRVSKNEEIKLKNLKNKLEELKQGDNSTETIKRNLENCVEQLRSILELKDEDINEGLYERITKKIIVHPNNLLEFHLSFMPKPIYLQYRTSGRGNDYAVEFDIIQADKFAEMIQTK